MGKILNLIKDKGKPNKKEISKEEAEKILKEAYNHTHVKNDEKKETKQKTMAKTLDEKKSTVKPSKSKPAAKKIKKVSKK